MTFRQTVLLLGATGATGGSILEGLLVDRESFVRILFNRRDTHLTYRLQEVEALVRPSSLTKPAVKALPDRGVKIRVVDVEGPIEALVRVLSGVDVFISAIDAGSQLAQIKLATAAKEAGVKRFIPCAFMTIVPPGGVMALRDSKEEVYQHIRKLYLPYTVIDVGFWYQVCFPTLPSGRTDYAALVKPNVTIHNDGKSPTILIDLSDIGPFVARIIKDPRTLNKFVLAYGDVLSENEIFEIMERLSGEKVEREYVSRAGVIAARAESAAAAKADPTNHVKWLKALQQDYYYSNYVREDNIPAYAAYLGYLDARELYPDFQPQRFEKFTQDILEGKGKKVNKSMGVE
ncbi:isoflavone reductase family protein [Mycena filopes]|nr:isoflavone reductase family protein [Mycena filopes]